MLIFVAEKKQKTPYQLHKEHCTKCIEFILLCYQLAHYLSKQLATTKEIKESHETVFLGNAYFFLIKGLELMLLEYYLRLSLSCKLFFL